MSVFATAWAWRQDVPAPAKLVLLKLADQANDDGEAWPARKTIATHTGLGETAVKSHLKKLRELGLIETYVRTHNGRQTSNAHRLLGGGREATPRGSGDAPPGGREATPNLSEEPTRSSERAPDLIWDSLVTAIGEPPRTKRERGKWNAAAKDLRDSGVTAEEIRAAVDAYGRHPTFKECALTPMALVTNLSTLLAWARPAEVSRADDIRRRMDERGIE